MIPKCGICKDNKDENITLCTDCFGRIDSRIITLTRQRDLAVERGNKGEVLLGKLYNITKRRIELEETDYFNADVNEKFRQTMRKVQRFLNPPKEGKDGHS